MDFYGAKIEVEQREAERVNLEWVGQYTWCIYYISCFAKWTERAKASEI